MPNQTPNPASALADLRVSPALNVLRICALAALPDGGLDDETMAGLALQVRDDTLARLAPLDAWRELSRGLMGEAPSRMLRALQDCGALSLVLPEVDSLSGMPQADSTGEVVDLGAHTFTMLDLLARAGAPLPVRLAALLCHIGKSDSPPEHLPTHYRHVERAMPRISAICARFQMPDDFLDLALLCVQELERIHKATEMRAGALTMLLERTDAFARPLRFARLLQVCAADYGAFPSSRDQTYPKAPMLLAALDAAREVPASLAGEALLEARADAVSRRLRSLRWS